jgi:hypothetical protein
MSQGKMDRIMTMGIDIMRDFSLLTVIQRQEMGRHHLKRIDINMCMVSQGAEAHN